MKRRCARGQPRTGPPPFTAARAGRDAGAPPDTGRRNTPPDTRPHWSVVFAVEDCDASAAKVSELGGSITVPPMDIPVGRFAVARDVGGASFGIIKLSS